ncbi:MAG: hypothetical protein AAF892_07015 [Cyanobacteria bacterium P01_D01_bin.71]
MGYFRFGQGWRKGRFQCLKGFPVEASQSPEETIILEDSLEIQHGTTRFDSSLGIIL